MYGTFRLGEEMVELRVGMTDTKAYQVHKRMLFYKIPYFDRMFHDGWKKVQGNTVYLYEDDNGAWEVLLTWVCNGQLP